MKKQLIIKLFRAPGDVLVLSNLIKHLGEQLGESIEFDALTPYSELFYKNPYLSYLPKNKGIETLDFTNIDLYAYRRAGIHYSTAFIYEMNEWLEENGFDTLQQIDIYPEIHLTDEEKDKDKVLKRYNFEGDFWLINPGFKIDMPLKAYPHTYWRIIINELTKFGIQLIQVGSNTAINPEYDGIYSLIGKTENLRSFISLCYHSSGCISLVSLLHHIAASFKKPCVTINGGRENNRWEEYDGGQYLSSVGYMDCCQSTGCWLKQRNECINMIDLCEGVKYPKCMTMISPSEVINSVIKYDINQ